MIVTCSVTFDLIGSINTAQPPNSGPGSVGSEKKEEKSAVRSYLCTPRLSNSESIAYTIAI